MHISFFILPSIFLFPLSLSHFQDQFPFSGFFFLEEHMDICCRSVMKHGPCLVTNVTCTPAPYLHTALQNPRQQHTCCSSPTSCLFAPKASMACFCLPFPKQSPPSSEALGSLLGGGSPPGGTVGQSLSSLNVHNLHCLACMQISPLPPAPVCFACTQC